MISRILGNVRRVVRPDDATLRFIRHNRRVWPRPAGRRGPEVLIDNYNVPQSTLAYSYLANALLRRHGARLVVFGLRPVSRQLDMFRVFRSFGATGYVQPRTSGAAVARVEADTRAAMASLHTKRDLLDLTIDGIALGEDVYQSYLRRFAAATVDLADPRLTTLLAEAIGYLRFWQHYLDTHDVRALIVSHDCYIDNNVLCRLAYQRKIPAYLPHINRIVRLDRPNSVYSAFPHYRELHAALPEEIQREGRDLAIERLGRRISGDTSVTDIVFWGDTAFSLPDTGERVLGESGRLKVLICTHCFFDNPHIFGGMLFEDFAAWIDYVGRFAETTDHDWYLKTHPQVLPGTEEILERLLARHPRITRIPSTIPHHQLVREGVDIVLTCYGSVGEEYPLLGVNVLTNGYHPRIAYDFNHKSHSLEEYEQQLRRLPELAAAPIARDDVYEFYFMHHIFSFADDLVLDSYEAFATGRSRDDQYGPCVYDYFLDRWDEATHRAIVDRIDEYLDSGLRFRYRYGCVGLPGDDFDDAPTRALASAEPHPARDRG